MEGVELNNAKRLIDAVLLNFNQEETDCRLSLPYLHELNGEYEKALIAYAELLLQVQSELPPLEGLLPFLSSQFGKVESSPAIRDGDALEGFSCRFKILQRMKLIVEKLSQTERLAEINLLIENLPDDKKIGIKFGIDRRYAKNIGTSIQFSVVLGHACFRQLSTSGNDGTEFVWQHRQAGSNVLLKKQGRCTKNRSRISSEQ